MINSVVKLNIKSQIRTEFIGIIAIVVIIAVFTVMNPNFLGTANIYNLLEDISMLLILATGMTFVLIIGSIDLAVGAASSCASVFFVMILPTLGLASFPVTLAFGIAMGVASGFIFAKLKVPSFIATFGTMNIYHSLALLISEGASQQISKEFFPTGNVEKDLVEIGDFYKNVNAKRPKNFSLPKNFLQN